MQIIVIRHAKTGFNAKQLINGTIDEPLSEEGVQQIPGIISSLKDYELSVVYTSLLQRSIDTGNPIAKHYGLHVLQDPRLTEVSMGSFEGQPWGSTIPTFGLDSSGVLSTCQYDFKPYGGETSDETRARVEDFIADLKSKDQDNPLIVSHGGIIRWFYHLYGGQTVDHVSNTDVHVFTI